MDDQYKVEFLPTVSSEGKFKVVKPLNEIDLKYQFEALLIERYNQGYKFVQFQESIRTNPLSGQNISGLIIVFEKIEVTPPKP